jgi:hypothetical protein
VKKAVRVGHVSAASLPCVVYTPAGGGRSTIYHAAARGVFNSALAGLSIQKTGLVVKK